MRSIYGCQVAMFMGQWKHWLFFYDALKGGPSKILFLGGTKAMIAATAYVV